MVEKSFRYMRMRQLPRAEYALLKALIDKYHLHDQQEAFVIALRLWYEVLCRSDLHGDAWVQNIIRAYRDAPQEKRVYEV